MKDEAMHVRNQVSWRIQGIMVMWNFQMEQKHKSDALQLLDNDPMIPTQCQEITSTHLCTFLDSYNGSSFPLLLDVFQTRQLPWDLLMVSYPLINSTNPAKIGEILTGTMPMLTYGVENPEQIFSVDLPILGSIGIQLK